MGGKENATCSAVPFEAAAPYSAVQIQYAPGGGSRIAGCHVPMHSKKRNAAAEARGVREIDHLGGKVNQENSLKPTHVQGQRGGRRSRAKGDRIEREIVARHAAIGIKAERYPLSGASRFRGSGHDVEVYAFGPEEPPLVAEVKARQSGAGFVTLGRWLGEYDALFLRRNNEDAIVLLPWRVWTRGAAMNWRRNRIEDKPGNAAVQLLTCRVAREPEGDGWLVITRRGHDWLHGSRESAVEDKRWLDEQWRARP